MLHEKSPKLPASGLNDQLAVREPSLAAGPFWRARNPEGSRVAGEAEGASGGRRENREAVPARRRVSEQGVTAGIKADSGEGRRRFPKPHGLGIVVCWLDVDCKAGKQGELPTWRWVCILLFAASRANSMRSLTDH
jgi:hypothetical protein